MASTVEKQDHNMMRFNIVVSADDFKNHLSMRSRRTLVTFQFPASGRARLMRLVTNYYGEGILYEDAIDHAAQPAYEAALKEHGIEPFSQPNMDVTEVGSDKGLTFVIDVAVKPEVTLGVYDGVEAFRPDDSVSDDEVDREIQNARLKVARMVPIGDRPIAKDDTVTIDYEGLLDGVPFEGGTGADYDLKIGSNAFIPGFEDGLIGKNVGDELDLPLTFPESYHAEELKGKDVVFRVTIHEARVQELPPLDDEFVKDVSDEYDTLDEFRRGTRERLEKQATEKADQAFEENIVRAIVAASEIDLPEVVIREEAARVYNEQSREIAQIGLTMDQYLQYMNTSSDRYLTHLFPMAENRVRTSLVLEHLTDVLALDVSDEEVEAEYERISELQNIPVDQLKERYRGVDPCSHEEGEDCDCETDVFVRDTLKRTKTIDWVRERAVATDVDPNAERDEADEADEVRQLKSLLQ